MKKDYIGNLRVLAKLHQQTVSEQNLQILRVKYGLTDDEYAEMTSYCSEHGIRIYDEKEDAVFDRPPIIIRKKPLTEEQKQFNIMAKMVSDRIMAIATKRARERAQGQGWLCGTYTSSVGKTMNRWVRMSFTADELRFITDHLVPVTSEGARECFALHDPEAQALCDEMNVRLNEVIPALHVNMFFAE